MTNFQNTLWELVEGKPSRLPGEDVSLLLGSHLVTALQSFAWAPGPVEVLAAAAAYTFYLLYLFIFINIPF